MTWNDPAKTEEYLGRIAVSAPRLAGEAALREVVPTSPSAALDLGCGDGRLAALVLEERPPIERIVAVDVSPPMLSAARQRFAREPRVEVRDWDLRDPITPLGPIDLVVSGFAIHHVGDRRKRALFAEIARQLRPGGVLDWMREANLVQVDCLWKWRGFALLVGEAPAAVSPA